MTGSVKSDKFLYDARSPASESYLTPNRKYKSPDNRRREDENDSSLLIDDAQTWQAFDPCHQGLLRRERVGQQVI